jgi:hypothetical protein
MGRREGGSVGEALLVVLGDPRVEEYIFDRDALIGVHFEHVPDEHAQLGTEGVGQVESAGDDGLAEVVAFAWG